MVLGFLYNSSNYSTHKSESARLKTLNQELQSDLKVKLSGAEGGNDFSRPSDSSPNWEPEQQARLCFMKGGKKILAGGLKCYCPSL